MSWNGSRQRARQGHEVRMTGRAMAVLLSDASREAAVITHLTARAGPEGPGPRLRFTGPVDFDESIRSHLERVLLPLVDRILEPLHVARSAYELSAANLGATGGQDLGLQVSGYSADVPILLTLLSASLELPVPGDVVATGHLASSDGDIVLVRGLPAKLGAARDAPTVRRFVHPIVETDGSLAVLAPHERERVVEALHAARDDLDLVAVGDVGELLSHVFAPEAVVRASLQCSFFSLSPPRAPTSPAERAVGWLLNDNSGRFWTVLEQRLLDGKSAAARDLLTHFVGFFAQQEQYPAEFGQRLADVLRSLPPTLRRCRGLFPLLPTAACIQLSQHATRADHDDVPCLLAAASGRIERHDHRGEPAQRTESLPGGAATKALDALVHEIDSTALAELIDRPIDEARATYRVVSNTVADYDEFLDTIAAFYLHLARHAGTVGSGANSETVAAEAHDCLEHAFARSGGAKAAWAEAREPLRGGVAFVLNIMTQQYKHDARNRHVRWVFKNVLDPLDWEGRVALMKALLARLGPGLPADLREEPAERFAKHYERIVDAYVRSADQLRNLLRTL